MADDSFDVNQLFQQAHRVVSIGQAIQHEVNRILTAPPEPLSLCIGLTGGPRREIVLAANLDPAMSEDSRRDRLSTDGVALGTWLAENADPAFLRGLIGAVGRPDV